MPLMFLLAALLTLALQSPTPAFTAEELWTEWPEQRFVQTPAPCMRPAELVSELNRLVDLYPNGVTVELIGQSVQGRPIHMMTLGHGPTTVLLWSQMHGDEPSATPALLDIADFLLSDAEDARKSAILDELTLLMVPMLNPDGAEVYERRNVQGIDINRDALMLSTPEGQLLKKIRDEYEPVLGFNLHDQSRRVAVGDTGVLATNSVLAVSGDPEGTVTPGRLLAKRACSAIVAALEPFSPGGVARFDEDWNPRAFGDNMTAWGTPVVLIESGGLPPGAPFDDLTRLNFVAILTALEGLARNDLRDFDPQVYEDLPRNRRDAWVDVVVRGGFIRQAGIGAPYRADLAFNIEKDDRDLAGCPTGDAPRSYVVEIGDARFLGAGRVVDASGSLVVPVFTAGVEGWKARRWLTAQVLEDVARLGVGSVVWGVPPRKAGAARSLAQKLNGSGGARLEVVSNDAEKPWLKLNGPPGRPASSALPDVVAALSGTTKGTKGMTAETLLDHLNRVAESGGPRPALRRGRPASFVVLAPAKDGEIDSAATRLVSVSINGQDVKGDSR